MRVGHGALCTAVLCTGIAAATAHAKEDEPCGTGRPSLTPSEVLGCVGDDVAHITTGMSAGSAVLLPDGRLVTNAHVVDPFARVRVAFRDGEAFEDVPVVGVDLQRDIAVLGPIDRRSDVVLAGPVTVGSMAPGDPLFLVGYPGDIEPDDPVPAISEGILSRERVARRFGDQRYLQTDASIGGGQSGGALVDDEGRVVGISGLSFAEGFALALSSPDVLDGMETAEEHRSDYHPTGADEVKAGSFENDDEEEPPLQLSWAPEDEDREVAVELEGSDAYMEVVSSDGETLWSTDDLYDLDDIDFDEIDFDSEDFDAGDFLEDRGRERRDQTAEFTIPAGQMAVATLFSFDGEADYHTSVPATEHRDEDNGHELRTGMRVEGSITSFEMFDTYEIELDKGQRVDIYVGSVGADMSFAVYRKAAGYEDATVVDDSAEGFYGTDAHRTYTAERDGTHVIEVASMFPGAYGYVLELRKA